MQTESDGTCRKHDIRIWNIYWRRYFSQLKSLNMFDAKSSIIDGLPFTSVHVYIQSIRSCLNRFIESNTFSDLRVCPYFSLRGWGGGGLGIPRQ